MASNGADTSDQLLHGMICLSLAVGFEEDRARRRLSGAL
jgi:hypothetical protein